MLQKRRDRAAAKRFLKRALEACSEVPGKIVTDRLRGYPAAKAEIPEFAPVGHAFVRACARVNNCAENSPQPSRESRTRSFRLPVPTHAFLPGFGVNRQHFAIKRHLPRTSLYRKQLTAKLGRLYDNECHRRVSNFNSVRKSTVLLSVRRQGYIGVTAMAPTVFAAFDAE